MGENSKIEWTDHTFNPWMGCTKVSPACTNCYAERDMDKRLGKVQWGPSGTRVITTDANWNKPLQWNRTPLFQCKECGHRCDGDPIRDGLLSEHSWDNECGNCGANGLVRYRAKVFCASLADVFEDWKFCIYDSRGGTLWRKPDGRVFSTVDEQDVDGDQFITMDDLREKLFRLIDATPNLDWLLLTKRPENIRAKWHPFDWQTPSDAPFRQNVWLGTSVESSQYLPRIDSLKAAGGLASVLFISAEPVVGPMPTIGEYLDGIDWLIAGGESGPNARPSHPDWFRSLRDQCDATGVPFHFKQWGEWVPAKQTEHGVDVGTKIAAITLAGRVIQGKELIPKGEGVEIVHRAGKKNAGRLLDGMAWNGLPALTSNTQ